MQRLTEEERLDSIAAETSKIIRVAMVQRDIPYVIDLAGMIGMGHSTLAAKMKSGYWTQKDLCRLITVLKIPPEDAVKMLGVRL